MEVVVTGLGPVLPSCTDRHMFWSHLCDGASQLTFEAAPGVDGERWAVGRIRGFDPDQWLARFPRQYYRWYHREQQLYLASLAIALDDAGLALEQTPRERIGLFDGTSRGNFDYWYERIHDEQQRPMAELYSRRELLTGTPGQAANLGASLLGIRGPVYTYNVTCCSGAVAIGHAYRELLRGDVDVAFATGHDSALHAPMYWMYRDAGLLSEERDDARRAIRPFQQGGSRNAFGEGAITLVLETRAHAERRGAVPLATIAGFKYGNNGGHTLDVDKEGGRVTTLMTELLATTGVERERIGFVVGHGNGVAQSDLSEVSYMQRVFAGRAPEVPLLSTKPIYGHLLGGSSALNIAAAVLMLHHGVLAPTINVDPALAIGPIDHVTGGSRPTDASAAMSVSYGIGGHNAVTLLTRSSPAGHAPRLPPAGRAVAW